MHTKLSDCEYPANFVFACKPATLATSRTLHEKTSMLCRPILNAAS